MKPAKRKEMKMKNSEMTKIAERAAKNIENIFQFNGVEIEVARDSKYYVVCSDSEGSYEIKTIDEFDGQKDFENETEFGGVVLGSEIRHELAKQTTQEFLKKVYAREYSKLLKKAGVDF